MYVREDMDYSIYLRPDEIKPGVMVRSLSYHTGEIAPALIIETGVTGDFVRVLDHAGETFLANILYLERWK